MAGSTGTSGQDGRVNAESNLDAETTLANLHRLVHLDPPTLRKADVEALSGVAHERSVRWWRAMGFPEVPDEERAFRDEDVEMVRTLDALMTADIIGEQEILRLARVSGVSFSRLVDAQLAVLDDMQAQRDQRDAVVSATIGQDVMDLLESTMTYVWKRHLMAAMSRRLSTGEDQAELAVGFADLSGFSRVSKKATASELTHIIDGFEAAASDVVSANEGRVVKMIGDEVMFVTSDLDQAIAIGLDLIERLAPVPDMPPVHCGVASGSTVTVGGDVFGPVVNLASRLTGIARPGSIAVPTDLGRHLLERDDIDVRRVLRPYDLKGVGRTTILAIRPPRAGV